MKKNTRILLGIAAITAVTVAAFIIFRKKDLNNDDDILSQVSEEGYETAHDVLFPSKFKKGKDKDLRYGPILPR